MTATTTAGVDREERNQDATQAPPSAVYLLTTTQQHHVQLSLMADGKASALMAADYVTLSVIIAHATTSDITPALIVGMAFATVSAAFAVLAVLPRVSSAVPAAGNQNLLFFGGFAHMSGDDYVRSLMPILEEDRDIFETMLRDIHSLGVMLMERKYRYLALAFRTFLIGLFAVPATLAIEAIAAAS